MPQDLKNILYYASRNGEAPFIKWLEGLDHSSEEVVIGRLERIKNGNFGDYKNLGEGVFELRIHFGPGYRIYYGMDGATVVLLLCGGDKNTQTKDIKRAKFFWENYKNEKRK